MKLTAECTRESKGCVSVEPERLGTKATPSKVLATVPLERALRYSATGTCTGCLFCSSQSPEERQNNSVKSEAAAHYARCEPTASYNVKFKTMMVLGSDVFLHYWILPSPLRRGYPH